MTETFMTIIAGVGVFALSEWLKEVWLMPLQEYKKLKSKVSYLLILHAQYYANPIAKLDLRADDYEKASASIRELAAELAAYAEIVPLFHAGIPNAKSVRKAAAELIGISNGFFVSNEERIIDVSKHNSKACDEVKKLLKLRGMVD